MDPAAFLGETHHTLPPIGCLCGLGWLGLGFRIKISSGKFS